MRNGHKIKNISQVNQSAQFLYYRSNRPTEWHKSYSQHEIQIGSIYFNVPVLITNDSSCTTCSSKSKKTFIFLQNAPWSCYDIHFFFFTEAIYSLVVKNDELSETLWAFIFLTWTADYTVDVQMWGKHNLLSDERLCNDVTQSCRRADGMLFDSL